MQKIADITFENNKFTLSGELNVSNVMSVYDKSIVYLINCSDSMLFDFGQIKSSDSSGLALIIEWVKLAHKKQKKIQFINLSQDLLSIARASGLDKLIHNN